jgi:hypothetical protein
MALQYLTTALAQANTYKHLKPQLDAMVGRCRLTLSNPR